MVNQGCMPLSTYFLEYSRHVGQLHRHRHRREYAPISNTASHDNHEKINSWVSFSFLYEYGAPLGGPLGVIFAGVSVNSIMIRLMAQELSSDPEFKVSPRWYTKWKRRNAIPMRCNTTLAQHLPADMEDKIVEFHHSVLRPRQRCSWIYF